MERTRINKKASAILTSDWHLREDVPICRVDNYWEAQWKKVDFIYNLQVQHGCPVIHGGDLFDHWKPSPNLIRETIERIPQHFYTIYGQHDLPQHSLELVHKCGINTLEAAQKLKILTGTHWGVEPDTRIGTNFEFGLDGKILVWHHLTYQKSPFPGASGGMASGILQKYPQYNLILTGDNHQAFTEEFEGRRLVNPGSIMRMDADQIDFQPRVYLWYAEDNSVEPIFLPIDKSAITREHLEKKEERDARIDAFVSRLDGNWETKLTFEENLENFKAVNKTRDSVMQLVYKAIES
jgi:DNA repair exonuclease SbcCD nuclease subunit